jgi:hypothetical protein
MLTLLLLAQLSFAPVPMGCPAIPTSPPATIETIHIPKDAFPEAEKRAKLSQLLIDSLRDQGKGIFDLKREREIQKLMKELKRK